jgi:hypothetical protein
LLPNSFDNDFNLNSAFTMTEPIAVSETLSSDPPVGDAAVGPSETTQGRHSKQRSGGVNKPLPLEPIQMEALQAQKRQYSKILESAKTSIEVDPNQAYPDLARSTTLILSSHPLMRLSR